MKRIREKKLSLHHKILLGMLLGIPFGLSMRYMPFIMDNIEWVRLPGEIFLNLIVLIVIPLVFASITAGTASLGDLKKLGRIGSRTFIYYMITTVIAITIGLVVVNVIKPGTAISEQDRAQLLSQYKDDVDMKVKIAEKKPKIIDMIRDIIPINPVLSLSGLKDSDGQIESSNTMLQIIFISILFGVGITLVDKTHQSVLIKFFSAVTEVTIALVKLIMKFAPIGVFSLISVVLAGLGLKFLGILLLYAVTVLIGFVLHIGLTYCFVVSKLGGIKPAVFFRKIQSVMLVAFSTSSSGATLPVSLQCAERDLGVKNEVASFVLPLGVTINMDGTALYQAVAAVFIAQVFGMHLSLSAQLTIIFTATLASIGTAGVPAVGIVMLIIVLNSIDIPVMGIALILAIDRILDMCRTTMNVTGDLTAAVFMDKLERNYISRKK